MAPEIFDNSTLIGMAVDIYACGIVLFAMMDGDTPFKIAKID